MYQNSSGPELGFIFSVVSECGFCRIITRCPLAIVYHFFSPFLKMKSKLCWLHAVKICKWAAFLTAHDVVSDEALSALTSSLVLLRNEKRENLSVRQLISRRASGQDPHDILKLSRLKKKETLNSLLRNVEQNASHEERKIECFLGEQHQCE